MRRRLYRIIVALVVVSLSAPAGINWKTVWLEPNPVLLPSPGATIPYTVSGINGRNYLADLTHNRYLSITSSDENIIAVDKNNARLIGGAIGHVEIRVSFSECTSIIQAWVRDPYKDSR